MLVKLINFFDIKFKNYPLKLHSYVRLNRILPYFLFICFSYIASLYLLQNNSSQLELIKGKAILSKIITANLQSDQD